MFLKHSRVAFLKEIRLAADLHGCSRGVHFMHSLLLPLDVALHPCVCAL